MKPVKYKAVNSGGRQMLTLDLDDLSIYGLAKIELD